MDVNVKWGQATAYRDRAAILAEQKKYDEAVTDQQRAREILEGLVSAHMEHTGLRDELVKTLKKEIAYNRKIGNRVAVDVLERKEKEHQEILDRVLAAVPDTYDNVVWNTKRERALAAQKHADWNEEYNTLREGIAELQGVVAREPDRAAVWATLSDAQQELAKALTRANRLDESEKVYREALDSAEKALARDSGNPEFQNLLSRTHIDLGEVLKKRGKLIEALEEFRAPLKAERLAQRLNILETVDLDNERHAYEFFANERQAYELINETLEKMEEDKHGQQTTPPEMREQARREQIAAAWLLSVLSARLVEQAENYYKLGVARRYLSKLLAFERANPKEAIYLLEQARGDIERSVKQYPRNAEYRCRLGEVDYAIGRVLSDT